MFEPGNASGDEAEARQNSGNLTIVSNSYGMLISTHKCIKRTVNVTPEIRECFDSQRERRLLESSLKF